MFKYEKSNIKFIIIACISLLVLFVFTFCVYGYFSRIVHDNNKKFKSVSKNVFMLYKDYDLEIPKKELKLDDIKKVSLMVNNLDDEKDIKYYKGKLNDLENYVNDLNLINNIYINNILIENVSEKQINTLNLLTDKLNDNYKSMLIDRVNDINGQYKKMINIMETFNNLYDEKNNIKDDVTVVNIDNLIIQCNELKQDNLKKIYISKLNDSKIKVQERDRIKAEKARKLADEEARKQQELINNSWVILNVPYISQNQNGVLNGCEAAALLMSLQYKGYLKDMNLVIYSTNMPKSTDPYQGFTHDIFGLDPLSVPHWIAPAPLAAYGRNSSGANVVDGTGKTLDELDRELDNNNPVVIYATAKFKPLKQWVEGAPKNLHVQLLVGYNKITKEHIIVDPWTQDGGKIKWYIPYKQLVELYDAVGRKNVIVKG